MPTKSRLGSLGPGADNLSKGKVIALVCGQQAVAGEIGLARLIASNRRPETYTKGRVLTRQGDDDTDMFFILGGSVAVEINGREIASRKAGQHVGEMALLEPNSMRRHIAVERKDGCIAGTGERISRIAKRYSSFWRRLAVELATRLRERSRFIRVANATPVVFVGSSSKALNEARWIAGALERRGLVCKLWNVGVFNLSRATIEDLEQMASKCDYAMQSSHPDDITESKGASRASPRDNVIFELGLFMGALSRQRTFCSQRGQQTENSV